MTPLQKKHLEFMRGAEQEPLKYTVDVKCELCGSAGTYDMTIDSTPPQRTWVGLTDEEVDNITAQRLKWQVADLVDAIEEALRRKNND